jgi:NADH:ubiquinone oxidoreductase subunit 6 (subunit J)
MGHFLILAALYINLKPLNDEITQKRINPHSIAWILLLAIAIMVHFYLVVMVFALWIADLLRRTFFQKSTSLIAALIEVVATLLVMALVAWQVGYFAIESASGTTRGFGDFRTNLLVLLVKTNSLTRFG